MRKLALLLCAFLLLSNSYSQEPTSQLNSDIIPIPSQMSVNSGFYGFDESSTITIDKKFGTLTSYITKELKEATDFDLATSTKIGGEISFIQSSDINNCEGYNLEIGSDGIKIYAKENGGVVYAVQTLKQLIALNNKSWAARKIFVPTLSIKDYPAFGWRGFMLDVSRSYYRIEEIKKFVDYMALLKLNRLHLHLSDDQGFRVEMKKYKKLNEIGSWRADRVIYDETDNSAWGRAVQKEGELANYGGYYSINELKDLVAYAKERNIEILPEIDVPGHAQAIIASYPEFSCEPDHSFQVATGAVRKNNTLCPSTEATYEFLDVVIGEICDIFPFEYIHIGGDECNKEQWNRHTQCEEFKKANNIKDANELQSYFIHRIEDIVNSKGKSMIGWDEILDGGLAPNATVMSWRGEKGGVAAAKMGHDVIMSPNHSNYLDLKQGQSDSEPNLGYGQALITKSYNFKIIPDELTAEQSKHILGNQANLWSETFAMPTSLWYMALPRLYAVAENAWSQDSRKNWGDFVERIKPHFEWMDFNGIRHAKSLFNPWMHHKGDGKTVKVWFTSQAPNPVIRYTLDGTKPTAQSVIYSDTLTIKCNTMLNAAIFDGKKQLGDVVSRYYAIHKAAGAKVKVYSDKNPEGDNNDYSQLTDLTYGQFLEGGDKAWLSFKEDPKIEITFTAPTDIEAISVSSQRHTLSGRYAAKQIIVYGKCAGGNYKEIGNSGVMEENIISGRNLITNRVEAKGEKLVSIIVEVKRQPTIPEGYVPDIVGNPTTLQLDEIVVL